MLNGDKALLRIRLAGRGQMLITIVVRGDRDSRATLMPIYGDLYQIKL